MPEISRFFGIIVTMYHQDHEPPHFHARYGEYRAILSLESLDVIAGKIPNRAHVLLIEWALAHKHELRANWQRAKVLEPLLAIAPLE